MSALDMLRTEGNRIVSARTGLPVLLRGVNRSGLEYCSPEGDGALRKAGITEGEMDEIVLGWRANIIRVPFNQRWALDSEAYCEALDQVIEMATTRGAYVLLALQWLDAETPRGTSADGKVNFVAPLPDDDSAAVWEQLSLRYRHEPGVLYDVYTEPHDPLEDDETWTSGDRVVTASVWGPWAARLVAAVQQAQPEAAIFVSGTDWGYDLRGMPLAVPGHLVYSTHIYSNKRTQWDKAFGELALEAPVFAGEWGGTASDAAWGQTLIGYMAERGMGWTAWSWADWPNLVDPPPQPPYRPTPFGALVYKALAGL